MADLIVGTEHHNGHPYLRWSDGTLLPVISGGDGTEGAGGTDSESVPDDENDEEPEKPKPGAKPDGVPPEVKAALRKANKEAETLRLKLKEIEDKDKSETQKLSERAEAAEKRAAVLEHQSLRAKVGAAKGLPPKMWDRLVGDDESALKADADDLLAELKPNGSRPSFDGGAKGRHAPADSDMNALIRGALRR